MAKKSRPRGQRREAERAQSKLQQARQRLFELELGVSAAVVEAHAESVPCPRCDGKHEVIEHVAVTRAGIRLREARLRCRQCGTTRSLWFRIADARPN
jgi:transposase-like protein